MVKVGLPPDPVVSERTIHDLILWVSSPQDINIPGFTSLQSIPEVNIFLSANMVLSFNLDALGLPVLRLAVEEPSGRVEVVMAAVVVAVEVGVPFLVMWKLRRLGEARSPWLPC